MTEPKSFIFRFGEVEAREREYCLIRAGETLRVEPTAFRVLLYLLRNPGRLITKDEIMGAVWGDTAVSDNSLTRSVATLRRLLEDDPREPHYIATVQTLGYRFLSPVEAIETGRTAGQGIKCMEPPIPNASAVGTPVIPVEPPVASRRAKGQLVMAVCGVLLLILIAGFTNHRWSNKSGAGSEHAPASGARKVPVVTVPGRVEDPAFSPDGREIAFTWNGLENQARSDIYVQLVGGEKPLRLTHTTNGFVCCADWSPDGREIVYGRCDDNGGAVFVVPALGGMARKLTDVFCPFGKGGYPRWIADGKSLLLADRCTPGGSRGLVVFAMGTGERRCLTAPPPGGDFSGDFAPVMSPDHKTVAFLRTSTLGHNEIYLIDLSGRNLRQLTHDDQGIEPPMWTADGRFVLFKGNRSGVARVWRVSVDGGPVQPETVYPDVGSLSREGQRLAYVEESGSEAIWRADLGAPGGKVLSLKKILTSAIGDDSPQLTSDDLQVVFRSSRSGKHEIWRTNANGDDPLRLTTTPLAFPGSPRWSPDAKWIAFDSRVETHCQIYMVDSEGRNLHKVTSGDYENNVPGWSRDGKSIYFSSNRTGELQLWRRDLSTARETQVTVHGGFAAFESYGGGTLYFSKFDHPGIWTSPVEGRPEERITEAPHVGYWGGFAVTEDGIYILDVDAVPNPAIIFFSFLTRKVATVLQLDQRPASWTPSLAASRDGRTLLLAQGLTQSYIVMAENFH